MQRGYCMKLDELEIGKDAIIESVDSGDAVLRQHIFDMGLTPGTEVTMMKYAPMGDPLEIRLRGYELTLRRADAARISLANVHDAHDCPRKNPQVSTAAHPAFGEEPARPRREGRRPFPRPRPCALPSPVTRTAAKRRFSTSSPAPTNMWATSQA